jgi:predicted RNase H-like HicB family nuclease
LKVETVVEILSEETNFAVIRVFSRNYPGVLIQGDSLMDLVGAAKDAIELFEKDKEDAIAALTYVYDELNWRFENYKKVLEENKTPFPS